MGEHGRSTLQQCQCFALRQTIMIRAHHVMSSKVAATQVYLSTPTKITNSGIHLTIEEHRDDIAAR